jgi:hypothetical protein
VKKKPYVSDWMCGGQSTPMRRGRIKGWPFCQSLGSRVLFHRKMEFYLIGVSLNRQLPLVCFENFVIPAFGFIAFSLESMGRSPPSWLIHPFDSGREAALGLDPSIAVSSAQAISILIGCAYLCNFLSCLGSPDPSSFRRCFELCVSLGKELVLFASKLFLRIYIGNRIVEYAYRHLG